MNVHETTDRSLTFLGATASMLARYEDFDCLIRNERDARRRSRELDNQAAA